MAYAAQSVFSALSRDNGHESAGTAAWSSVNNLFMLTSVVVQRSCNGTAVIPIRPVEARMVNLMVMQ